MPSCDAADALKTLTRSLLRTLKDKVAAVFSASLLALRALVAAQAGSCAPRDLQAAVGELLPLLVEKAADLNQRTREQATEALVALAGVPQAGLRAACGHFLRPTKPNAAWKTVVGRWVGRTILSVALACAAEQSSCSAADNMHTSSFAQGMTARLPLPCTAPPPAGSSSCLPCCLWSAWLASLGRASRWRL